MRRFLVKVKHTPEEDVSPHSVAIEGAIFSGGLIVIYGSFFRGVHIASLDELEHMIFPSEITWIDEKEQAE